MPDPNATIAEPGKETPPAGSQGSEKEESTKTSDLGNKSNKGGEGDGQEESVLDFITKRADGKYELRIDPDDPESTVYEGKTQKEVLDQWRNGTKVKDSIIRKAKIAERMNGRGKKGGREEEGGDEDHRPVKFPNESEITRRHFKEALERTGIKAEMVQHINDKAFWKKHQDDNELDLEDVLELKQRVRTLIDKVNDAVDAELSEQTALYQNEQVLAKVTKTVSEMLDEAKIPLEQVGEGRAFDFDSILAKFYADLGKNETLDSGDIIAEAHRVIRKIQTSSNKSETQRKLEEDAEKARKAAGRTASPGGTGAKPHESIPPAADYRSATRNFLQKEGLLSG